MIKYIICVWKLRWVKYALLLWGAKLYIPGKSHLHNTERIISLLSGVIISNPALVTFISPCMDIFKSETVPANLMQYSTQHESPNDNEIISMTSLSSFPYTVINIHWRGTVNFHATKWIIISNIKQRKCIWQEGISGWCKVTSSVWQQLKSLLRNCKSSGLYEGITPQSPHLQGNCLTYSLDKRLGKPQS